MSRQQKFEQAYAEAHGMPVETFEAYRMGDTYRLPGIAKCWRFWNMALDSVVVQLPKPVTPPQAWNDEAQRIENGRYSGYKQALRDCKDSIEGEGWSVAP